MFYIDIDPAVTSGRLERRLGLADSTFLVIGAVFGSGIFLTSGVVASQLPYPGLMWLVWIAGGILTVLGALTYAELGALFPESGGPYVYFREAFGDGAAFVFGWTFFWIISGGGVAALGMGFAEYFGALLPRLGFSPELVRLSAPFSGLALVVRPGHLVAIGAILGLSALNAAGLRIGARFQSAMTVARLLALAAFIVFGLASARRLGGANLSPFLPPQSWPSWTSFGAAFLAVIWTYDGWYAVSCTAEEVRDPARTLPRSLVLGTAGVAGLYLAANIVYSMSLSVNEMSGIVRIGFESSRSLFGPSAASLFTAFIALAILGCLSANILFCPRVAFAMSRDGLFFRSLGRVSPRFGVPSTAVLAQGAWAALLCFGGTYATLIDFVAFALVLFFGATGIALFILRRRLPEAARPFRVPGYPLLPGAFILANLAIAAAVIASRPMSAVAGLALILTGAPAFLVWRKGASA
jgi:basic amino acid/polyamine antiporter, APA family